MSLIAAALVDSFLLSFHTTHLTLGFRSVSAPPSCLGFDTVASNFLPLTLDIFSLYPNVSFPFSHNTHNTLILASLFFSSPLLLLFPQVLSLLPFLLYSRFPDLLSSFSYSKHVPSPYYLPCGAFPLPAFRPSPRLTTFPLSAVCAREPHFLPDPLACLDYQYVAALLTQGLHLSDDTEVLVSHSCIFTPTPACLFFLLLSLTCFCFPSLPVLAIPAFSFLLLFPFWWLPDFCLFCLTLDFLLCRTLASFHHALLFFHCSFLVLTIVS